MFQRNIHICIKSITKCILGRGFNINVKKIFFKNPDRNSKLHLKREISYWSSTSSLYY